MKKIIVNLFCGLLSLEKSAWPKTLRTKLKESLPAMIEAYLREASGSTSVAEILWKWCNQFKVECNEEVSAGLRRIAEAASKKKIFNETVEKDRENV